MKKKEEKSPMRREEMKGGGMEKEKEGQKWNKDKRNDDNEGETTKKRTQKSGKKRWENKHGKERGEEKEYKTYEWDRLIGDQMDIKQEEDIRIGTWNIRKQATLGLESEELRAKIEIVMDYMRSMDIQIMALQETGRRQEQARAIESAVNSREYKAYTNPNKGGLAIIIHKKIDVHRSRVQADLKGEFIELLLRPTSATGYKNRTGIALYNIHMETGTSVTDEDALPRRLQEEIQIQRKKRRKICVIGDWNCAPKEIDRTNTKKIEEGEKNKQEEARLESVREMWGLQEEEDLNTDVFRELHPNLAAYTRHQTQQNKETGEYINYQSRIDLMIAEKEIVKTAKKAAIIQDTCLESDHHLCVFDLENEFLHIQKKNKIEENPRHTSKPKNWTVEQIREYTELTDFKEEDTGTAEIEDIDMQWTGFAKKLEKAARKVEKKEEETEKETQDQKSKKKQRGKPWASAEVCKNARKRRWMRLVVKAAKEKAEKIAMDGKIPSDIKEHAKIVFVTSKGATLRQAIGEWERQINEQKRNDNKKMMRERHEKMDEIRRNREEKLKDPKKKGEVIRSLMGITKSSDPVKAVWAEREGKEVHVNDAEGVREEVKNFFQTIFDSRGRSIDEGDSYEEVLAKMDERIREGYKKQREHLWANAYRDDGKRPFTTEETRKYLDKTANGKAGGHTGMSRELLKWMGEGGTTEFTDLLNAIWKRKKVPEEWTQGILHPLEKVKGKVGLDNIRPITLLEVALKTITGLLSDRMLKAWQRENI